jgi:predicted DNA-binding protein YlxM (UPF0122 family)
LKQRKSLSEIVENYLVSITAVDIDHKKIPAQVQRLKGVIKLSKNFDHKKSLTESLNEKYGK